MYNFIFRFKSQFIFAVITRIIKNVTLAFVNLTIEWDIALKRDVPRLEFFHGRLQTTCKSYQ